MQTELQAIRAQLAAQNAAENKIIFLVTAIAGVLGVVALFAFTIQIWTIAADAKFRRDAQAEATNRDQREAKLNEALMQVLQIATKSAQDAQQKVIELEKGGIQKASETLTLINSLLAITERTAAKAAGAQFEFLTNKIKEYDAKARTLIANANEKEEREIIANPDLSAGVRTLTSDIINLDNQISIYNETVPVQYGVAEASSPLELAATGARNWRRLGLTGPCLFIRGQNHLQHQNFVAAKLDWEASLEASGADFIEVDANYWIGYVNNTLGEFGEAPKYLKAAQVRAPDSRKTELVRLELESRFFGLELESVPDQWISDAVAEYEVVAPKHLYKGRAISSFATTIGNMIFIRDIRNAAMEGSQPDLQVSTTWFKRAIAAEPRSRWARFGIITNHFLAGNYNDKTDEQTITEYIRDVIRSANTQFQDRYEIRSKVLNKATEYICVALLGKKATPQERDQLPIIASLVDGHASEVRATTMYSQFRKQNVQKRIFLDEFKHFRDGHDLSATMKYANTRALES